MGMSDRDPLYRRHRFPAEIIAHAVWLYFRFPLSLRMVEDMLAARVMSPTSSDLMTPQDERSYPVSSTAPTKVFCGCRPLVQVVSHFISV